MSSKEEALAAALAAMNSGSNFFDVTIICTTDDHQAEYWMDRFRQGLLKHKSGDDSSPYPMVLAVSEDWNDSGGAGNGLGTLYAFEKAAGLAKSLYPQVDLMADLAAAKVSAALYHTAGKGTRLAPLPASENNNKPGVKLPFPLRTPGADESHGVQSLTVLEAVVKQTGIYAASRKGRLSVFWGDQVFLPTATFTSPPTHHIDILCTLGDSAPSAQEWSDRGLDKYGVIACMDRGDASGGPMEAAQVEKVSHETAVSMLQSLGSIKQVGPSLGSFSVSAAFLQALLKEFDSELKAKTSKLDTDPHFWMPLTLPEESYVKLMEQKGTDIDTSKKHYQRMTAMKESFDLGSLGLFGAVTVGEDACWWDYGQLKLYSKNSLLLLDKDSASTALLRRFLGLADDEHQVGSQLGDGVKVDNISYVFGSKIKNGGSINNSILSQVSAGEVNTDGAIIVNCAAKKITAGKGCILYNLIDDSEGGIVATDGQVMVAVTDETGSSKLLQSRMDIDGGKAWKQKLDMNEMSFEDVHKSNKNANIREIAKKRQENYDKLAATL